MKTQRVISIVRCHAEGEVGDVIVGGVLPPPGRTMFERMTAMQRDQDGLRRLLLCEPRGSVARHIYGGMWYAITDATKLGFRIEPDEARELAAVGEKIRLAARAQLHVVRHRCLRALRRKPSGRTRARP